ncbi:MAG: hypothetical protein ACFB8W_00675 [Elainellaceae cyanobacterium]
MADRYGLMAAILNSNLSQEEREAIDRILWSVRRGRIKMVDDLSALQ